MAKLLLFNKPYRVLSQFTDTPSSSPEASSRQTLADFINLPNFYPAGRLDYDSEGLLLLTDNGGLQARIADPKHKLQKSYWVQVEGRPSQDALKGLSAGIELKDGLTLPAQIRSLKTLPPLWKRVPCVPEHRALNSSWLEITLTEGRNRQVRRMCAAINHPVLRLIRHRIGVWQLRDMQPGEHASCNVHLPTRSKNSPAQKRRPKT
ncbi:MAG: pseudouridine synthase [Pseudomonadales bacterium]|nr:pseudouridine synthase [Pseudomonadales bacterium]